MGAVEMRDYQGQKRPPFAEQPAVGQESVSDYPRPPRMEPDTRRVEVRREGKLIADSRRTCRVLETASPPTFYIPPADVAVELLRPASATSFCEWKGVAHYWALRIADASAEPIGWSYPEPTDAFASIAGYFSFYPARVQCYLDGERVRPQPGGFYGGWVTGEIVGPFKGEPGTDHW
ncbi:MAG: DUF427 domain-containing protein [Pseudomonadota bacterium]|nr:DUF427 domain-containing protein [Pseudomonadota bacterium]